MSRLSPLLLLPLLLGIGGVLPAGLLRAAEAPQVAVRSGAQAGTGRLLFEWPNAPGYTLVQDGAVVDLRFGALHRLVLETIIAHPPPNVLRVEPVPNGLRLHLREGTRVRHFLQGPNVVVEFSSAQTAQAPRRVERPAQAAQGLAAMPAPTAAAPVLAQQEEAVLAAVAALAAPDKRAEAPQVSAAVRPPAMAANGATSLPSTSAPSSPEASPVAGAPAPAPPAEETTPRRDAAARAEQPAPAALAPAIPVQPGSATLLSNPALTAPAVAGPAVPAAAPAHPAAAQRAPVVLPFAASVHAAAIVRGDSLILAFDDSKGMKADMLRRISDSVGAFEVLEVPGSTVLRQRLPMQGLPKLRPMGEAWALWPAGTGPGAPLPAVIASYEAGSEGASPRLLLSAEGAGRVIAIPDPAGEGLLLVGLVAGPGVANPAARSFEPFDILPTELGVALAIHSDAVTLRPAREGFAVPLARTGPLAITLPSASSTAPHILDLPNESSQVLDQRRRATFGKLVEADPQARGELRLDLAQGLLALGLGAEAQGLALMAVSEDPRLVGTPRALMLTGAAALVAGRRDDAASSLTDPRLPDLEETRLWRALSSLEDTELAPEPARAITDLATTAPMLRNYPTVLRQRLLPLAVRALATNGALDSAVALLDAAPAEDAALPAMAYARARLAEARGDKDAALSAYDDLASSRDSDMRARALGRLAELRLARGEADAATTAAALAAAIPSWRGDARELGRRLRAISLYQQGNLADAALELLEETESLFPEAAQQLAPLRQAATFGRATDPGLSPLEAAQRLDEGMESLPAGPALDAAALRVANGLAELDLHAQGAALLQRAAARSAAPAALRLRQAEMLVSSGQGRAALDVLQASAPSGVAQPERREQAEARARALAGDGAGAEAVLRGLGAAGAAPLADLLAERKDWAGAAQALGEHAAAVLPAEPALLDAAQSQLLLRLAAFSALSGDEGRVAKLRATYGPRMAKGPLSQAFATLVAEAPRRGAPSLDQLRNEVAMSQKLSEQLRSLR